MSSNLATPSGWRIWFLAARPRTLPAAIVPVLVGSAVAVHEGRFHFAVFAATLIVSLLLQIGANYANDLFDFLKGADHQRQGPLRVTQSKLVTPRQMTVALIIVFGTAGLIGIYLAVVGGWPIVIIGVVSMLAAIGYTAGPFPLAYRGLGDLAAFVFFGLVAVMGTTYLHLLTFSPRSLIAALPVALLVTAIIIVNNLRDIQTDRAAGKITLAVRIGDRATRLEYTLCLIAAYIIPIGLMVATGTIGWWWLAALTVPYAYTLIRTILNGQAGQALNQTLGRTAQLHLYFGVLFAISWLLA
ncbi:MAG: 1,4-dihydroxy-2-naphthoate polyprenyltransferase [Thermoflexales bacterium]|nr:1,4-dihydroxy-2-naphthoate polyprenyltransferase [Thermoflexales bacterium]